MAHFAQIDENNIVTNVITISNDDIIDATGKENETIGIEICKKIFGENTKWIQTSYNSSFRKNYAIVGETYDIVRDAFRETKPFFASWILNETTCKWEAPVNLPEDSKNKLYEWNESTLSWIDKTPTKPSSFPSFIFDSMKEKWIPPIPYPTDGKDYRWNEKNISWVAITPILDGTAPKVI